MAVRALNSCINFRSAASPPLAVFRSYVRQFRSVRSPNYCKLGFRFSVFGPQWCFCSHGGRRSIRSYSVQRLVDTVMEELETTRKRRQVRVSNKLATSGELFQDKLGKRTLQKGLLLEFKKDTGRVLLAVAQKPDGKKNWMVFDQNGVTTSIKLQQITFIVPGIEDFDHTEISDFIQRAQSNLDPALLEFAWIELLEKDKSVTIEQLAEMIFGSAEPLESYRAHLLLSNDDIYFTVLGTKGPFSVYGPRPARQVEELLQIKLAKELAQKEFHEFIKLLKSTKEMPPHAKPSKSSWRSEEKIWYRIESLEAYAVDHFKTDDQKKTAGMILKVMGLAKTSAAALNLLIDIGISE